MNRKERRSEGLLPAQREKAMMARIEFNASHWEAIKRLKREYDALPDTDKQERKPEMAAQIDQHLAALIGA